MNNNDLGQFRKVIREEVTQIVDEKISASEKRIFGKTDERISVSEKRLTAVIDEKISTSERRIVGLIDEKITASEKRVIGGIGTFLSEEVLPQIDEKADKTDIERLERKLDKSLYKGIEHENRIKAIEQIPVIAHEIRSKKPRT